MANDATAWMFESCPDSVEFADDPAFPNDRDKLLRRIVRSFIARRIITGVTQMPATAAGNLETGTPSASVGSNAITGSNLDSTKWICTANETKMNGPVGTDSVIQTQTWVTYSAYVSVDLSTTA